MWNYFVFIRITIVIIPQFIITYFIITITHIFTYINFIIIILTAIIFKFIIISFEFIFCEIKIFIVSILYTFQCRIFFQFFFYSLLKMGRRYLQQFHELNLLRR